MMTGVTVLDKILVTTYSAGWGLNCWIISGIILLLATGFTFIAVKTKWGRKSISMSNAACVYLVLIVLAMMLLVPRIQFAHKHEQVTYQVYLTDEVKITEFQQKYEIIGEKGITYIVKER